MAQVTSNGITIEYESLGENAAPVVLLVMGLGMQLIAWADPFCERLVQRGFRVVRFDNRDCGLSQKMDHLGFPNLPRAAIRSRLGLRVRSPYTLEDMAQDTVGLLDALGIRAAHVVGASLGGMISQVVAANSPDRVLSLTSIMSTTGARHLPQASAQVRQQLLSRPSDPTNVEALVSHLERTFRMIGSPGYPTPPDELRARIRRAVERGYYPAGVVRQLVAVMAHGDRSPQLSKVRCPTLVIHGKDDPLVPCAGAIDTALRIRDATLVLLDGYGHDFPAQLHQRLADYIAGHALAASGATMQPASP
jgi:pimeloyl-ACP methyl ester carboxylesterase